jgi:AcrR family transcriptional regulator
LVLVAQYGGWLRFATGFRPFARKIEMTSTTSTTTTATSGATCATGTTAAPDGPCAPRPLRADAARNRQRLVDAAVEEFAAHGADASLEQIAARAGVGIGTLYRHFPDRQALLVAVYQDGFGQLAETGRELLDADDPFEALAQWLAAKLAYSRSDRALAASVIIDLLDRPETAQTEPCESMRSTGNALLQRAVKAGAVRKDVTLDDLSRLVGAIALASGRAPEGDCVCSDRLFQVMLDGLRPRA